ncbi:virulence RhuM family protein [Glaesserella parasuis]|uniref:virulence RhuM family protein n=1 Tax=Glaesserella parasuis TaxID=738 RepID=UPI00135D2123|nr:virulence RhuM family protein [Glaesserella parasuis]MWP92965.1 virulence RhuM family protein [Glaesserella parasuis]
MSNLQIPTSANILFYTTPDESVKVNIFYQDETFWLSQKSMAELFGVDVPAISKHLDNIYSTGELVQFSTISKMEIVQQEGHRQVTRLTNVYNLDAIIAVGYRVNSREATQFRIWAIQVLREFILKGFVFDDERLKQGKQFGLDYFTNLVERIREIRASERRFYEKITDIYALASDYDKSSVHTKRFFSTVQNKLHWAITGKTAAELIYTQADAEAINMGLTTWKNAPDGKILKSDVSIAKNYLSEQHIKELEQLVSAYLDLAENRATRQILTSMAEWETFLDSFLTLSNYPILRDKGKISHEMAKLKAEQEYDKFRIKQDRIYRSDFNHFLEATLKLKK